jgi:hypothetical protein
MRVTFSEIVAYGLLQQGPVTNETNQDSIHDAANHIIELAERIKAERAVAAMEKS